MKIDPALALLSAALEQLHSVGLSLDQIEKSGRRPELSTETGRTRDDLRHTITAVRARIQEHADLPEWARWARTGTRGFPALSPRVLPIPRFFPYSGRHEVHFAPDLQAKIDQLVIETGRAPDKLLEDAMAGYVAELAETRDMLDSRYDDLKSGRVKPIPGEEVEAYFREKSATARRSQPGR